MSKAGHVIIYAVTERGVIAARYFTSEYLEDCGQVYLLFLFSLVLGLDFED